MTAWPGERALHGGADPVPLGGAGATQGGPGALWLCGKHFVGPDPEAALARTGTTVVVCLCERGELNARYPEYTDWLRANQPHRALWAPIPDLGVPPPDQRDELLAEMAGRLRSGQRLLLHCGAGLGRAGTLAAAVLITLGMELDQATTVVAGQRPMAGAQSAVQAEFLVQLAQERRSGAGGRRGLP